MTTDKQPTWDDLRRALQPVLTAGADIANRWMDLLDAARTELADLNGSAGAEPVDVATARDQVVTAALRYAAAEGDAGTSLADTNTALTVLDDALAGYVGATGSRERHAPDAPNTVGLTLGKDVPGVATDERGPTVPAVEALRPGNEVAFTVRGFVGDDYVTIPAGTGDICDSMRVQFVAEAGCDFRIIRHAEGA